VLGAVRGGADSLLVLTGVTGVRELVAAPVGSRPTYVSSDLRGLLCSHPEVEVDGETARCGSAVARWAAGLVRVESDAAAGGDGDGDGDADGDADGDDGLRALVALAWSCADRGLDVDIVR
jgi:hypothetical protein